MKHWTALTHSLTSTATNVKKQTMLRKTALTTMNTLSMVENGAVPLLTHSLTLNGTMQRNVTLFLDSVNGKKQCEVKCSPVSMRHVSEAGVSA